MTKQDRIIEKQGELIGIMYGKVVTVNKEEEQELKELILEIATIKSEPEEELFRNELMKCDTCGCHPSAIIRTQFGSFCQLHAKY